MPTKAELTEQVRVLGEEKIANEAELLVLRAAVVALDELDELRENASDGSAVEQPHPEEARRTAMGLPDEGHCPECGALAWAGGPPNVGSFPLACSTNAGHVILLPELSEEPDQEVVARALSEESA